MISHGLDTLIADIYSTKPFSNWREPISAIYEAIKTAWPHCEVVYRNFRLDQFSIYRNKQSMGKLLWYNQVDFIVEEEPGKVFRVRMFSTFANQEHLNMIELLCKALTGK